MSKVEIITPIEPRVSCDALVSQVTHRKTKRAYSHDVKEYASHIMTAPFVSMPVSMSVVI